jgi:hypothetical protein
MVKPREYPSTNVHALCATGAVPPQHHRQPHAGQFHDHGTIDAGLGNPEQSAHGARVQAGAMRKIVDSRAWLQILQLGIMA